MPLLLRAADPRLRPLLARELVASRRDEPEAVTWLAAPRPVVTLIVDVEGELRSGGEPLPAAWIGGLADFATEVTISGGYAGLDVKLTPLGAYRVLGMPVSELAGDVALALDSRLVELVREGLGWAERFELVEEFLRARAAEGPEPAPLVEWAWRRIRALRGDVRVGELAAEIGCSRRYLQSRFVEQVGLAPKTVIRLTRFEHVCEQIDRAPGRWADIAARAGYADQSHLNREFRQLAGITPSEYVRRARAEMFKTAAGGGATLGA